MSYMIFSFKKKMKSRKNDDKNFLRLSDLESRDLPTRFEIKYQRFP